MKATKVRLAVGMPVYNGENYIEPAVESVLAQTFTDFELHICDNASTDRTQDICQAFARRDSRVHYHRQPANLGGARNWNDVFARADTELFKWMAHDDVLEPRFLERCVAGLDADPSIDICQSATVRIGPRGERLCMAPPEPALSSTDPVVRFRHMIFRDYFMAIWGVMRSRLIRKTRMQQGFSGADRCWMAEMMLFGRAGYIDEPLCLIRDHPDCYSRSRVTDAARRDWFDPSSRTPPLLQGWLKYCDYFKSIRRAPLTAAQRLACASHIVSWASLRTAQRVGSRLRSREVRPCRA